MLINAVEQGWAEQLNSEVGLRRFTPPLPQHSSLEHHVQHPSHLIILQTLGCNISDARGPGDLYSGVSHANTGSAQHQDIENSAFLVWERDHNKRRRNREVEGLICTSGDSGVPSIRTSRIRMGDLDVATTDYFRREGWNLSLGRSAAEPTSQRTTKSVRR